LRALGIDLLRDSDFLPSANSSVVLRCAGRPKLRFDAGQQNVNKRKVGPHRKAHTTRRSAGAHTTRLHLRAPQTRRRDCLNYETVSRQRAALWAQSGRPPLALRCGPKERQAQEVSGPTLREIPQLGGPKAPQELGATLEGPPERAFVELGGEKAS